MYHTFPCYFFMAPYSVFANGVMSENGLIYLSTHQGTC